MTTLSDYITDCRRLLHDANGNFYSDSLLTSYINDARMREVRDTGCLRDLQSDTALYNQETYDFATLARGDRTIDLLNINLIWGNTRIPLRYLPWTQFNAELRFWENYNGRPIAFSMYGPKKYYLGPKPDQTYSMELDTVYLPEEMTSANDVETIPDPFTSPIPFYACYKAKYFEQSFGEAEIFKQQYMLQTQSVLNSTFTRRMPNPYSTPY